MPLARGSLYVERAMQTDETRLLVARRAPHVDVPVEVAAEKSGGDIPPAEDEAEKWRWRRGRAQQ
jgi:hypothetical protein